MLMASSSILTHKKCHREEEEEEDVISRLPDAVLCHILSFLPTKDAVRTGILSKRWNHIWTSVPTIEIDNRLLLPANFNRRYSLELKTSFTNFVDRVLRLNDVSCLRKFSLCCFYHHPSRVREWIKTAFKRDVEELHLSFHDTRFDLDPNFLREHHVKFPHRVFTSKKLVILKLCYSCKNMNNVLKIPALINLPSLKILHLQLLPFLNEGTLKNLIDGCPVLEELDIVDENDNDKTFTIRSNSLKSLSLHTEYSCSKNIQLNIVLDTKNLERLNLVDHVTVQYDVNNLSALVQVNLAGCIGCSNCLRRVRTNFNDNRSRLVELLRKLSSTKYLVLSCDFLRHLKNEQLNDLPMFHNLTRLKLGCFNNSFTVLPYLFERSPNLSTFVFDMVKLCKWPSRQFHAPNCLMLNLEEIKLTGFRASADEMEMVRYFLKSAAVLKKMSIKCSYSGPRKMLEISQQLLTMKRGSNKCQIIFN